LRKASIGLTRAALRAGSQLARRATAVSTTSTDARVVASSGHPEQQAREAARQRQRPDDADAESQGNEARRGAEHHDQHLTRRGPERHAHTDLTRALRHQVRHDAAQSDRGEQIAIAANSTKSCV
jgi:hypothetical protein